MPKPHVARRLIVRMRVLLPGTCGVHTHNRSAHRITVKTRVGGVFSYIIITPYKG